MDFNTLEKLTQEEIRTGIKTYQNTAKDLLECGKILADKDKFGPAIAMTVLSIEELIKSYAAFMYFVGDRSKNNIDAAFKGTIDAKSVHQTRLKYASGLNFIMSKINIVAIEEKLESFFTDNDLSPKKELKTEQDKLDWFKEISDILIPIMCKSELGLNLNDENLNASVEDNLKDSSNWFLHAKTHKENGIYADFINESWHSPSSFTKEKYDEAKSHAEKIFHEIGDLIEKTITEDPISETFIKIFVEKFTKTQSE